MNKVNLQLIKAFQLCLCYCQTVELLQILLSASGYILLQHLLRTGILVHTIIVLSFSVANSVATRGKYRCMFQLSYLHILMLLFISGCLLQIWTDWILESLLLMDTDTEQRKLSLLKSQAVHPQPDGL